MSPVSNSGIETVAGPRARRARPGSPVSWLEGQRSRLVHTVECTVDAPERTAGASRPAPARSARLRRRARRVRRGRRRPSWRHHATPGGDWELRITMGCAPGSRCVHLIVEPARRMWESPGRRLPTLKERAPACERLGRFPDGVAGRARRRRGWPMRVRSSRRSRPGTGPGRSSSWCRPLRLRAIRPRTSSGDRWSSAGRNPVHQVTTCAASRSWTVISRPDGVSRRSPSGRR